MHTSPFVLVLVLDRLSSSTSTNARQIELTISGSLQAAARLTARSCSPEAMRLLKQRAKESGRMEKAVLRASREVLLGNLELTEKLGLKRAACLLFSDRPEQYVSGASRKSAVNVGNMPLSNRFTTLGWRV